eukprot:TRINITY_DN4324_c0_g1_i7.p1 TRINITY_DN4324_c0_g1~~TRINITY_DN4324_c0_g1_i7.p1  ORF type:complete len:134 (+),score=19.26 TRINITY_DN4324_c0_g1_i7:286-687(+)
MIWGGGILSSLSPYYLYRSYGFVPTGTAKVTGGNDVDSPLMYESSTHFSNLHFLFTNKLNLDEKGGDQLPQQQINQIQHTNILLKDLRETSQSLDKFGEVCEESKTLDYGSKIFLLFWTSRESPEMAVGLILS